MDNSPSSEVLRATGNHAEDIAAVCNHVFEVDDDNKPAPAENIPDPNANAPARTEGLYEGQSCGWLAESPEQDYPSNLPPHVLPHEFHH